MEDAILQKLCLASAITSILYFLSTLEWKWAVLLKSYSKKLFPNCSQDHHPQGSLLSLLFFCTCVLLANRPRVKRDPTTGTSNRDFWIVQGLGSIFSLQRYRIFCLFVCCVLFVCFVFIRPSKLEHWVFLFSFTLHLVCALARVQPWFVGYLSATLWHWLKALCHVSRPYSRKWSFLSHAKFLARQGPVKRHEDNHQFLKPADRLVVLRAFLSAGGKHCLGKSGCHWHFSFL